MSDPLVSPGMSGIVVRPVRFTDRVEEMASFLELIGLVRRVESTRGAVREWGSLDRLERWLRGKGFRYFWLQNELDPVERYEAEGLPRPGLK